MCYVTLFSWRKAWTSVTTWLTALNSVIWRLQIKTKYPVSHACCAGVRTRSYALQILHKLADYDTLWINSPLAGDSELNPCLKTPCVSVQINAISKIARFEWMINNGFFGGFFPRKLIGCLLVIAHHHYSAAAIITAHVCSIIQC